MVEMDEIIERLKANDPSLELIRLRLCGLTDVSFLNTLNTHVTVVSLGYNLIKDIPIIRLTHLQQLHLSDNRIEDITLLSECKSLTFLDLRQNRIKDISSLRHLPLLDRLTISENLIEDISCLRENHNLKTLSASHNKIRNISWIRGDCTSIVHLYVHHNLITDVSCLYGNETIENLSISENHIDDISVVGGMNVGYLMFSIDVVKDISPLFRSATIEEFDLVGEPSNEYIKVKLRMHTTLNKINKINRNSRLSRMSYDLLKS